MKIPSVQHNLAQPPLQPAVVKAEHRSSPLLPVPLSPCLLVLLLAAVLAAGCGQWSSGQNKKAGEKPAEVVVTTPVTGEVTDYQDFTGRLDALKTVDIRPRVSGYVTLAPFKEGDEVREGDLLFEVDPRTYVADRNQAEANLKLAEADSRLQQKNAARARALIGSKAMAQEDYETTEATAEKAKATVKAMEAARNRAQLYVDFTRVTAPWSGRISRRLVDPGNLVNADNTILTTLVTEDPLYAYFDVDERTYLNLVQATDQQSEVRDQESEIRDQKAEGRRQKAEGRGQKPEGGSSEPQLLTSVPVLMRLANETEFSRSGTVNFVDNRVNASTGTIRLRGEFPNRDRLLKPGMFARIRLPIGRPYDALLIPDEALLSDQGKSYVFVVKEKEEKTEDNQTVIVDVVEYRPVKVGQGIQGLRVIRPPEKGKEGKEGLSKGERVIVSGMQRVHSGVKVEAKMQEPPKPPESALCKLLAQLPSLKQGNRETRKPGDRDAGRQGTNKGGLKPGSAAAAN